MSEMSLPVDKLFCDHVVNKIIGHLEVRKTKSELIDELFTPTTAGKRVDCSFGVSGVDYGSCPCGNELLLFFEVINYKWNFCERHGGYVCPDCEYITCNPKFCEGICFYCLNYDCKVLKHFKETHPDICQVCHNDYPLYGKHCYDHKVKKCKDCYESSESFSCKVEGCDWTLQS